MTDAIGANRRLWLLTLIWGAALVASGWQPFDRVTWWMEVAPVLIALPILWSLRRRFVLTDLALGLIGLHGLILMLGGAYSIPELARPNDAPGETGHPAPDRRRSDSPFPMAQSSRATFSFRSCRSCSSTVIVAMGRASRRPRLIGSPVTSQ